MNTKIFCDIADIGSIHLAFDSGLEARICVSWLHPYKEHKLIVIGDSGMLVFDDTQPWQQKLLYLNYNSTKVKCFKMDLIKICLIVNLKIIKEMLEKKVIV